MDNTNSAPQPISVNKPKKRTSKLIMKYVLFILLAFMIAYGSRVIVRYDGYQDPGPPRCIDELRGFPWWFEAKTYFQNENGKLEPFTGQTFSIINKTASENALIGATCLNLANFVTIAFPLNFLVYFAIIFVLDIIIRRLLRRPRQARAPRNDGF